jgi:hypothetical protein
MGGDGGVIATQRAFARGVGKNEENKHDGKSVQNDQTVRATSCALTNEPLQDPIVCCELGYLFNKEALITALLEKNLPEEFSHIRGLKDIKELKFQTILSTSSSSTTSSTSSSSSSATSSSSLRVCPITQDEFNGHHGFFAIWTTGYVLSEKAIREMTIDSLQSEYGPFQNHDLIKLIPLEHEMDHLRAAMHHRRQQKKSTFLGKRESGKKRERESNDILTSQQSEQKETGIDDEHHDKKAAKSIPSSARANNSNNNNNNSNRTTLNRNHQLQHQAKQLVQSQTQNSEVFKNLFHRDGEKDKKDRDLFMTVAGIRYTLG